MKSDRPDIVVLGDCGVDLYARVTRLPAYDEKVPANLLGMYGGGVAANFACAAAKFGCRVRLVATVGDDPLGELAMGSVAEFDVDVDYVHVLEAVGTSFCFVALDDTGEKALTIVRTPTFFPAREHIEMDAVLAGRVIHIAPFDVGIAADVAEEARRRGVAVTVDLEPGMLADGTSDLDRLVAHASLALPNQLFLETLFPGTEPGEAAAKLLRLGPHAVIATMGAEGAVVVTDGGVSRVPAVQTSVVDTTGAGDCFNAAVVASWLRGETLDRAARVGAAAASLAIGKIGARSGLPDLEQAVRLVDGQGPRPVHA